MTHARLVGIETVCEQQHGVTFRRRHTDHGNNWAHDSDIMGPTSWASRQTAKPAGNEPRAARSSTRGTRRSGKLRRAARPF